MFTFAKFVVVLLLLNSLIHETSFGLGENARSNSYQGLVDSTLLRLLRGRPADEDSISNVIQALINAKYGNLPIYSVDIGLTPASINQRAGLGAEKLLDPFGTLSGCTFFFASSDSDEFVDSGFVGIFKTASIVWESAHILRGSAWAMITSNDINRDGVVDLVSTWSYPIDSDGLELWIFSWDGLIGSMINDIDTLNGRVYAVIRGTDFDLIDPAGNGVYSIRAYDEGKSITYSWNGFLYGQWPSTVDIKPSVSLPATALTVRCYARVFPEHDSLCYEFKWKNQDSSFQAIQNILLLDVDSSSALRSPSGWLCSGLPDTGAVYWSSIVNFESMIDPGKEGSGFALISRRLPGVCHYFVQGYRPIPMYSDSDDVPDNAIFDDLFTNSVHGLTIGPKLVSDRMPASWFIDTIQSYCKIADSLYWITDRSHYRSYSRHLESAKTYLGGKDSVAARSELAKMLGEVLADTASLTSEVYALLRYNLEYIIGKLQKGQ